MKFKLINILLGLTLFVSAEAQDVEAKVTASFDSSLIYIGDQIGFSIIIDQPANTRLALPFFKDTLCKNIEIVNGPVYDSVKLNDNRLKIIEKYLVTSFDSGHYQLPPVFAEIRNEKGLKRFYSDYSMLEVARVRIAPRDTTIKIFDIIKPYRAPVTLGEILPWILLAATITAGIWLLIRLIRKFRKPETVIESIIHRDPAHIIAFRELEKLRDEMLWQKGEIKKYYTRLTEILRQYLEDRFRVFSLELTTSETLAELVKAGFRKDESYNKLKDVLSGADLVKFAKYKPLQDENEMHFEKSWDFVQKTKLLEEPEAQAPGNGIAKEDVL
jgi:hypothetical protein